MRKKNRVYYEQKQGGQILKSDCQKNCHRGGKTATWQDKSRSE